MTPQIMPWSWYETESERQLRRAEEDDGALELAILANPERAEALHKALSAKPNTSPKPYHKPSWARDDEVI